MPSFNQLFATLLLVSVRDSNAAPACKPCPQDATTVLAGSGPGDIVQQPVATEEPEPAVTATFAPVPVVSEAPNTFVPEPIVSENPSTSALELVASEDPTVATSNRVATMNPSVSSSNPAVTGGSRNGSSEPATFETNPGVGAGGSNFKDSERFRMCGADSSSADEALAMLEAAYDCFIGKLGWRSSGLTYYDNDDTYYKTNFYSVSSLDGDAAGLQHSDMETGFGYVEVLSEWLTTPQITVHEYGHVVHFHQRTWVNQANTGAWWETVANWFSDTYKTSDMCAEAREKHGQTTSDTEIDLAKVIGDSFQVIVDGSTDSGNYYQAWPFLTYLTSNPDDFAGLGQHVMRQLMVQYSEESNETPLHTLSRVSENATVAEIVGNYWAHMAYLDIGHPSAKEVFLSQRDSINFDNLEAQSSGSYKVKTDRQPRYMGSNIIPLTTSGAAEIEVKVEADAAFTGTLAVHETASGKARYVSLVEGAASVSIAEGEEASLVVANTPTELIDYDGFNLSEDVQKGLDYTVSISGATA
ncbi:dockerin type 1 [Fusarium albosuccineum]|uniref:Dockerin type 1 n=1 Tax=Fusarium albosuccineum TaxID=1237068 RepID=A0A8H4P425_9HYPO|nr:dockerin type 1 [Fusarium albosuccineum]